MGMKVDMCDLSVHTLLAVSEYAARLVKDRTKSLDGEEPVSLSSLGRL